MNQPLVPFVRSVLHPTDFSPTSEAAFAHAMVAALIRQARLTILNASGDTGADADRYPQIRDTLQRWGLLEEGSPRSAIVEQLGVEVRKVDVASQDPFQAITDYLYRHAVDLVVLATEGRQGLPAFIRPSVAERVLRHSTTMTLFVPDGARGFVSRENGAIRLKKILVPVDAKPNPREALIRVTRMAMLMNDPDVEIVLLHVGSGGFPIIEPPAGNGCHWREEHREGDVLEAILRTAEDEEPDVVVMATDGRDGFLDVFRGSWTERVVRRIHCPLLAVPTG